MSLAPQRQLSAQGYGVSAVGALEAAYCALSLEVAYVARLARREVNRQVQVGCLWPEQPESLLLVLAALLDARDLVARLRDRAGRGELPAYNEGRAPGPRRWERLARAEE